MPGTYEIEWQPEGVLLMRRRGFFTVAEAEEYERAAKDAMTKAPAVWGLVVDVREAPPQNEDVQAILKRLMQFTVTNGVRRTAVVSSQVVTNLQQKRMTTAPGLHGRDEIAFYESFDDAVDDVRRALA